MNMELLDWMWFCGQTNVGIVQVRLEGGEIRYYIGSFGQPAMTEEVDAQRIADWGAKFPASAGHVLFGYQND